MVSSFPPGCHEYDFVGCSNEALKNWANAGHLTENAAAVLAALRRYVTENEVTHNQRQLVQAVLGDAFDATGGEAEPAGTRPYSGACSCCGYVVCQCPRTPPEATDGSVCWCASTPCRCPRPDTPPFEGILPHAAPGRKYSLDELLATSDSPTGDFVSRVLAVFDRRDSRDELFWRTGERYGGGRYGRPASFFVKCSDVFWWGTADLEEITPENVGVLEQSYADVKAAGGAVGVCYGAWLFAARVRGLRPQGASYPEEGALWPLFDACGPPREVGVGNPRRHPADR